MKDQQSLKSIFVAYLTLQVAIKAPIFLVAVLATEIMQKSQSNEKVNPRMLKDGFSSRTDPSIFTSKAPCY